MRVQGILIGACLLFACAQEPAGDGACTWEGPVCVAGGKLSTCEDGVEQVMSCSDICDQEAPVGCLEHDGEARCDCPPFPYECEPGTHGCAMTNAAWVCENGSRDTLQFCDIECEMSGSPISLGCYLDLKDGYEGCHCAQEGDACDQSFTRCTTAYDVASCVDGTWMVDSCTDVCGIPDAECQLDLDQNLGDCDC